MASSPPVDRPARSRSKPAFSLIELLVAVAILALILIALIGITGACSRMWSQGESQKQHRQRARAMLDFMARELREATLPLDGGTNSLQLIVTNGFGAGSNNAIFWQAPIATETSQGNLAEVGYFLRWTGNTGSLCRFFANPSDTNYLIYQKPAEWVIDPLLQSTAPGDKAGKYRGLFLENVVGVWISARKSDGSSFSGDSRQGNLLPSAVTISLALLDSATAQRVTDASQLVALRQNSAAAADFVAGLPGPLKSGASIVSTTVNLHNAR